jgi:NADH-quinone oxidoreductase subunit D
MPYTLKPEQGLTVDADTTPYLAGHVDTGDRWVLNFGPQHPATHTTLRLVLELDGERVVRCTPTSATCTRASRSSASSLDYNQYVTITSRMNYLSSIANNICWHHVIEKLFGIEITPRCKVLRTIMAEIGPHPGPPALRRCRHSTWAPSPGFLYPFNSREKIYDIYDYISGQRYHPDWTRVGGLMPGPAR